MKRRIICFATTAVALTLLSCASGLRFADSQPKLTADSHALGRIFFYRPSSLGAAIRPAVRLNGEVVGQAISQGFFYVDRPPGQYEVVTQTEVARKVSFVLEGGQTRFIRLSASMGFFVGHVYGELVDEQEGLAQIKKCKYTGDKNLS
jgi:hypothetical protein